MMKPNGYDEAKEERFGAFKRLPAGAYVCRIVKADETLSRNGRTMLRLGLDITEGEYTGFFRERFNALHEKNEEAKWPCMYFQLTDEDAVGRFKGFMAILKESNPGFKELWGDGFEESLKGKLLGGVFREEEYAGNDGKIHVSTKCAWVIPVSEVETTPAPEMKKLDTTRGDQGVFGYQPPTMGGDIPF